MAIKPAEIEVFIPYGKNMSYAALVFAQHYRHKSGKDIIKNETDCYWFNFNSEMDLLEAILQPGDRIKKAVEHLVREASSKSFKNLIADKFVIGFDSRKGYTVDALDSRHMKLIAKALEAQMNPSNPTAQPG